MQNRWSEEKAAEFTAHYGPKWGQEIALRVYSARLLGSEENLVLHGGGNCSMKGAFVNLIGERIPALYIKASGFDMATIEPEGFPGLDLEYLKKLRALPELSDEDMANEFMTHLLTPRAAFPSIETLVHAFIPPKYVDHTHADAVLALTNQASGERLVREALGEGVMVIDYVHPGFALAKATAAAFDAHPGSRAIVWMRHGLTTWGDTAKLAYDTMIELVSRAEEYLARHASRRLVVRVATPVPVAKERAVRVAPLARGLLAEATGNPDRPYRRVILQLLIEPEVLEFVDSDQGKGLALSPPLTSDHLIRTKALPLWIDNPQYADVEAFRQQLANAIREYSAAYDAYVERHAGRMPAGLGRFDPRPRVILMPGLGAICAGKDVRAATIARDITRHTLIAKRQVAAMAPMGNYVGLAEGELFNMEYRSFQHAKLGRDAELPLAREVAIVTGAAGAIGSAISQALLEQGCHVALTDLPGEPLDSLVGELNASFGDRVLGAPMDVADASSVEQGFQAVVSRWGGVDLVVVNAGTALVSSLADMDLDSFRKLERVNVEGTLLVLREAARQFQFQETGGDIVVVSTKNVFAPGAKFGAYSATKAAAHQLARIASLELAEMDVRVNMVAPDAVFAHGSRRSGLWVEVGPDRMRARGLDERGLEEYYRNRNLLKAQVTAPHVARAVLFFATRQTPTTGATIPVDGGLPDATPR